MKRLKLHITSGTKKMESKNLNPKEGRKEVAVGGEMGSIEKMV